MSDCKPVATPLSTPLLLRSLILTGSGHPITEHLISSGTSAGEPKLIPTVKDDLDRRALLQSLAMPVMNK